MLKLPALSDLEHCEGNKHLVREYALYACVLWLTYSTCTCNCSDLLLGEWERAHLVVLLEWISICIYIFIGDTAFWSLRAPALCANVKLARSHPVTW